MSTFSIRAVRLCMFDRVEASMRALDGRERGSEVRHAQHDQQRSEDHFAIALLHAAQNRGGALARRLEGCRVQGCRR